MNKFPFQHMPSSWFIRRREHLETYYHELSILKSKVARFANSQNVVAVLNAAEALNQLKRQIETMEENLEASLLNSSYDYDFYNKGDLHNRGEN